MKNLRKKYSFLASTTASGKAKIIYVDDVKCSLVSVKNRLHEQYDIYPAESVLKMYELLENIKADLILLDVNMPNYDGYEAIKSLKLDDRYTDIPVIFLTGSSDRESVLKGFSLGAVDYVVKPFSSSKLIESIETHLKSGKEKNKTPDEKDANKLNILAVDDYTSILKNIQFTLQDKYKVFILSNPEDVMDFLQVKKPDLILLDYAMPVLSGFDLIPMIRSLPDHKYTPIIILSTEKTTEHVNEAISLGACDFILKPFKPEELSGKVAKHIRKK